MTLRIYIPCSCKNAKSGLLLGSFNVKTNEICIIAVAEFPFKVATLNKHISTYINQNDEFNVKAIGSWFGQQKNTLDQNAIYENTLLMKRMVGAEHWLSIAQRMNDFDVYLCDEGLTKQPACIYRYDQKHIWKSCTDDENYFNKENEINIFKLVNEQKYKLLSEAAAVNAEENELRINTCCSDRSVSLIAFVISLFIALILNGIGWFCLKTCHVLKHTIFTPLKCLHNAMCYCMKFSSTGYHTCQKAKQLTTCSIDFYTKGTSKKVEHVFTSTFMDIIFGVMLLYFINKYKIPQQYLTNEALLVWVEYIGNQIQEIITWVMGIPAGLKLNDPLNRVLGHFFLYHVRLWLEYIRLILTSLPHLVSNCMFSACFGLSFLLMLISDVVSMLAFHVYVFYIYAGRLYNLQMTGLISLWRLFLGKKWNPLRQRVDTLDVEYQNTDRLFIGTLVFTVLLFLLPTTLVYYSIFAGLRLAVHLIQKLLLSVMFYVSSFPWMDLLQYITCPQQFKNTVRYEWSTMHQVQKKKSSNVIFHFILIPHSITTVISNGYGRIPFNANNKSTDLKSFIIKILHGDLMKWNTL